MAPSGAGFRLRAVEYVFVAFALSARFPTRGNGRGASQLLQTSISMGPWMRREKFLSLLKLLPLGGAFLLSGCDLTLLDPRGQIGADEKSIIIFATLLMLIVVVPVILLTLLFAWKYRASNKAAKYDPEWHHSNKIEAVVWAVPCLIVFCLAVVTWKSTHDLDPYKPIASTKKPITIEVVALDWKWLFIYPEQQIATVNEIVFPANTPVNFEITSGTVMNSFFIPQLGSQVYAMTGMETKLSLIADQAGSYDGISANFSGDGFSDMKFKAIATTGQGYEDWLAKVRQASDTLDVDHYQALAKPSERDAVRYYSAVEPHLFHRVMHQLSTAAPVTTSMAMPAAEGEATAPVAKD